MPLEASDAAKLPADAIAATASALEAATTTANVAEAIGGSTEAVTPGSCPDSDRQTAEAVTGATSAADTARAAVALGPRPDIVTATGTKAECRRRRPAAGDADSATCDGATPVERAMEAAKAERDPADSDANVVPSAAVKVTRVDTDKSVHVTVAEPSEP